MEASTAQDLGTFEKFFHLANDMLCVAGTDGYFKILNNRFVEKLGFTNDELLAIPFTDLVHPEDLKNTLSEIEKLSKGLDTVNFVNRFRCKNNEYLYFQWNSTSDKKTGELFAVARDITEDRRLQSLLSDSQSAAKIGGWELDIKTGETFWTPQIYEIYGVDKDKYIDVEIGISQYHVDDRSIIEQAVTLSINEKKPFDLKLRFIRANKEVIWVRSKGKPITNELGEVIKVKGIFQDINEEEENRRELQVKQQNLESLITHTPASVAMFDNEMRYMYHSKRWIKDYNLNEEDSIIGKTHYDVFPDIPKRWKNDHQRVLNGNVYLNPLDHWQREDGSDVYLNYELRPWYNHNNEIGGAIFFTQVITPYIEAQKNLEEKVLQLKQSNIDLEQFAFAASHDLQEPLRMIGNFTELLKIQYSDKLDATAKQYIDTTIQSSKKMSELIHSLLKYAKVNRTQSEIVAADIQLLINEQMNLLLEFIGTRNAEIIVHDMPKNVFCVKDQIGMVFYNLIHNGLKFNNSVKPKIEIAYNFNNDKHNFVVSDNGIGIDDDDVDDIFKAFYRLDKQKFEGSGIGLALCKNIIERHNGKITIDSNKQGTSFKFNFPNNLKK